MDNLSIKETSMKRLLAALLMVSVAGLAFSQAFDAKKLDLAMAEMHLAGPDAIYVTSAYYDGTRVSVLLKYDGTDGAIVYGPFNDSGKLLLDTYELGTAKLQVLGSDTLLVSDLLLGGQGFSGRLKYDGVYTLKLHSYWASDTPATPEMQVADLRTQLERARRSFTNQLEATEKKAAADLAEKDVEIAQLKREVATAAGQVTVVATTAEASPLPTVMAVDPGMVDATEIDFSRAEVHLAGPDMVYVTSIYYGNTRLSALLKYDGTDGALIYGPYLDSGKLLLDNYQLGHAKLRLQGDDTLVVTDLNLGGQGYSGRLKYDGVFSLKLTSYWQTPLPDAPDTQLAALRNRLAAATRQNEAEIREMNAEIADKDDEIADQKAEIDDNEAEIDKLERELAAAKRSVRVVSTTAEGTPTPSVMAVDPGMVDPSKIDMSRAELNIAGPDMVYVTNIDYDGIRLSALLKYDGMDGALIYGPYTDNGKLILDNYELGQATLRIQGNDTLVITDLNLGGQGYAGRLKYDGKFTLRLSSYWETMTPKTPEMQLAELNRLIVRYERDVSRRDALIATKDSQIADLEDQLAKAGTMAAPAQRVTAPTTVRRGDIDVPAIYLPRTEILSGFRSGRGTYGSWKLTGGTLSQTNTSLNWAKYVIDVDQRSTTTMYTFNAKAIGKGKVGYGLHFFAGNQETSRGYGYGRSFLLWLTRDAAFYGTDNTYIQLYRSYDDIKMYQVMSNRISHSIESDLAITVGYDRTLNVILVGVNGWLVAGYMVEDGIALGDNIALRTMGGPVEFSNLSVKVK